MSSYYEAQSWQLPARQLSWEPPSRSGNNTALPNEDVAAFHPQIEEVDRALDNLAKSGKLFNPMSNRRDSMSMMGGMRQYSDYDPRMGGMPPRHSISEYNSMHSHSGSNLQNFYAAQRHQSRPSEGEQMMQAKRRMAAQRERELRNYHQEQQYNRSRLADVATQGKPVDRAISPNTMNEEDRRELIARQHRALYGNDSSPYYEQGNLLDSVQTPRPGLQSSSSSSIAGGRGPSPRAYDQFGQVQAQSTSGSEQNMNQQVATTGPSPKPPQQRSRANSTSSPISNNPNFTLFETAAQQSSRTSTSSPGGSPQRQAKTVAAPIGSGVAPIGTRPIQNQSVNPAFVKRSTPPIPSPLSYGFAPNEHSNERSTSAASNPSGGAKDGGVGMGWGSSSGGVWGKTPLGVQASVWG